MSGLASVEASAGLLSPVPVLQTFHALGSVKRRHQGDADTSPAERVDLERGLCREVSHVIATCSDEVFELRRLGLASDHVSIVPCGVDTSVFTPHGPVAPRGERKRLLVLGRLVERKGQDDAVRALRAVPDAELVVVGGPPTDRLPSDPEVQRLRAIAAEAGVADVVVSHHVLHNVVDLPPFLTALTAAARRGVVVEMLTQHPMAWLDPLWVRFHDLHRPPSATTDDAVAVLRELGIEPDVTRWERLEAPRQGPESVARRLCLPAARTAEVDAALRELPQRPRWAATLTWAAG
jgi:glycosyltransferase involved in cell wall biosynthesis